MKTILFFLCCLCATGAFGQASVGGAALSNEPQRVQLPSHPEHAFQHSMGMRQDLLEDSGPSSAHGVRPLWEVAPQFDAVPLGDVARSLREEHKAVKKAVIVWQN